MKKAMEYTIQTMGLFLGIVLAGIVLFTMIFLIKPPREEER